MYMHPAISIKQIIEEPATIWLMLVNSYIFKWEAERIVSSPTIVHHKLTRNKQWKHDTKQ